MNFLWFVLFAGSTLAAFQNNRLDYTEFPEDFFTSDLLSEGIWENLAFINEELLPSGPPIDGYEPSSGNVVLPSSGYYSELVIPENILAPNQLYSYNSDPKILPFIKNTPAIAPPPAVPQAQESRPLCPPGSRMLATLPSLAERAKWFPKGHTCYPAHQNSINTKNAQSAMVFSQRSYQGTVKPTKYSFEMMGINSVMSYRITQNKIIVLDNSKVMSLSNPTLFFEWIQRNLDETNLRIENFRKHYPLVSDGLIVALDANNRVLIASYGKPPLGVILFRPEGGGGLKFIGRSSDDAVKALTVQDGDVIAVGPLEKILQLGSKTLQIGTSSALDVVAAEVYNPASDKSISIVATISSNPYVIAERAKAQRHFVPDPHVGTAKTIINPPSTRPRLETTQPEFKSNTSPSQGDDRTKRKRSRSESTTTHQESTRLKTPRLMSHKTKGPSSASAAPNLTGRANWFFRGLGHYSDSRAHINSTRSLLAFSQLFYQGVIEPENPLSPYMSGKNDAMGYHVAQDRIIALDGWGTMHSPNTDTNEEWAQHSLDRTTLDIREFRKMGYPLISDGLVVAISGEDQLFVASYGRPPLGAALLRPQGDWLKFIALPTDNTVETLSVQDGDIVVVGPLKRMLRLEWGFLRLDSSTSPHLIAQIFYGAINDKTLCIAAAISAQQSQPPTIRPETLQSAYPQVSFQGDSGLAMSPQLALSPPPIYSPSHPGPVVQQNNSFNTLTSKSIQPQTFHYYPLQTNVQPPLVPIATPSGSAILFSESKDHNHTFSFTIQPSKRQ